MRKQLQERKKHTRQCVRTVQRTIRESKILKKAKKADSKAREKAEEALTELQNCPYGMVRLVNGLKTNSKEVEEGRYIRGSDGKLCFIEKERGKMWKDYMERIMK